MPVCTIIIMCYVMQLYHVYFISFQMLMPTLREYIYKSRSCGAEAQHNVMHAVFLVLQSQPSLDAGVIDKGIAVFEALFAKFFLQVSNNIFECE